MRKARPGFRFDLAPGKSEHENHAVDHAPILISSTDCGYPVTVCQEQAGIDKSVQKAKDWIAKNVANTGTAAPEVFTGTVIAHLK